MSRQIASQTHQQKPTATPFASGFLQRKCACGNHTVGGAACNECSKKKRLGLQTKLKVNEPWDIYEQEADRIADQVMAMPANSKVSRVPPSIQRHTGEPAGQRDTVPTSVDQALASPGRPLELSLRQDMEQRFGCDFSRVRVHTGATSAQSAGDLNARAYTVGHDVVFGGDGFAPATQAGQRLIAHELAHVIQQASAVPATLPQMGPPGDSQEREAEGLATATIAGWTSALTVSVANPAVLCRDVPPESALPIPSLRGFRETYVEWQQHSLSGHDADAAALIPDLLQQMSLEDARQHAVEIAFWLMDRDDWEQARTVLRRIEDATWVQYITADIPFTNINVLDTPLRLYSRGRDEAVAGHIERAIRFLGLAYLFVQFILHETSQRCETNLAQLSLRIGDLGEEARTAAASVSAIPRVVTYREFSQIYRLLRDIVGLYPRLEREAVIAGNQEQARNYSNLGLLVRTELRECYTLSSVQALTMETAATTTSLGEPGYTIFGRDITTTETVTPLPGTTTPTELGAFPTYRETMEELMVSIAGQEEYLTEIFTYPEIRTAFRGALPDMNRLDDRLRVWRTMFRVYQREQVFPLGALMSLIRSYLDRFTFHSDYNIRDYGVSYLSTDFPEDLAGRAVRDCGAYALMTAYEVYHTARDVAPRLNLDFRLYAMPEHVILMIADRDEGNFYIVNNNQITGPQRGEEIDAVAVAYGPTFSRRFGVAAGFAVNLGSTDIGEATFRRQMWQHYQVASATRPPAELPPGAGPNITEAEVIQYTYRRYREDLTRFDVGAQRLAASLEILEQATASLPNAEALQRLSNLLPGLIHQGVALTRIFAERGPEANIIIEESRARATLGRGVAHRIPQIVGQRPIFVFSPSQGHPLARLAMALLRFEHLGGTLSTLSAEARTLIQALRLIPEFDADISAYDRSGRPAVF
jgi:hypothetical protein